MSIRGTPVKGLESAVPAERVSTSPRVPAGPTAKSAMGGGVTAPRSRRALLAGLAGGSAALAAGAIRGLPIARAGVDGDVVLGAPNAETTATSITNSTADADALAATAAGNGTGLAGDSTGDFGTGVSGTGASTVTSNSLGVLGVGDTGVLGAGGFGVLGSAAAAGTGVYGSVSDAPGVPDVFGSTGVIGQTDAGGTGVVGFTGLTAPQPTADTGIYGRSDTGGAAGRGLTGHCASGIGLLGETISGVGVRAYCGNNTGVGLRVTGKAAFDRSGKLTITAGHSSLTKTGIGLTSASFILATLQTNVAGLFVQAVVTHPSSSSFTIYLNKAPAVNVAVAWMAVN